MPQDVAELYATNMMSLSSQARGVIRDLNPKVSTDCGCTCYKIFLHYATHAEKHIVYLLLHIPSFTKNCSYNNIVVHNSSSRFSNHIYPYFYFYFLFSSDFFTRMN